MSAASHLLQMDDEPVFLWPAITWGDICWGPRAYAGIASGADESRALRRFIKACSPAWRVRQ